MHRCLSRWGALSTSNMFIWRATTYLSILSSSTSLSLSVKPSDEVVVSSLGTFGVCISVGITVKPHGCLVFNKNAVIFQCREDWLSPPSMIWSAATYSPNLVGLGLVPKLCRRLFDGKCYWDVAWWQISNVNASEHGLVRGQSDYQDLIVVFVLVIALVLPCFLQRVW